MLLLLALVPVVFDAKVFFPFVSTKALLIRGVVALGWLLMVGGTMFSKEYRAHIFNRVHTIMRHPLVWSVALFMLAYTMSALFAVNRVKAFWGDVERAEGVVGMVSFFGAFLLMALLWDERWWKWWFRAGIGVGVVLFVHALIQAIGGINRPGSWLGNPIYLAVFFLFMLCAGIVLVAQEKRGSVWRVVVLGAIPVALVGMLLTETRGVVAGILAALAVLGVWMASKKDVGAKIKRMGITMLGLLVLGTGLFVTTHNAIFWQNVPGVDRLAKFSLQDTTLNTRLLSTKISWDAINPANVGVKKFLVGWGPENFSVAYNTYYDPTFFSYETQWFDRAHNKLMDVWVMNGTLGLVAYLLVGGIFFVVVVKRVKNPIYQGALLFFGVAYFVQNLFVFDAVATYIIWMSVLAWVVSITSNEAEVQRGGNKWPMYVVGIAGVVWFTITLIWHTAIPYMQMRKYWQTIPTATLPEIEHYVAESLTPITVAQEQIRTNLLSLAQQAASENPQLIPLFEQSIASMEEYIQYDPLKPQHYIALANAYREHARLTQHAESLVRAREAAERAVALIPNRPDVYYPLGYAAGQLGEYEQSQEIFDKAITLNPKIADSYYYKAGMYMLWGQDWYNQAFKTLDTMEQIATKSWKVDDSILASMYVDLLKYFYEVRNADQFSATAGYLANIVPSTSELLNEFANHAQRGEWWNITLEQLLQ
jgi:tetratricopeptide (TPR) repeat protein